jgi:predicted hydrocarbon binding protein
VPHAGLSGAPRPGARAAIPLSILESLRHLDAPTEDGTGEFHRELTVKRLGMNETVSAQIERYERLTRRDSKVDHHEVTALFRLVGRRADAGLVFADAGRRVARRAVKSVPTWMLAVLPRFARNALSFGFARTVSRMLLDASLQRDQGRVRASIVDPPSASATADGAACGFYGSALAEILRALTEFDGALFHVRCRAQGDPVCEWTDGSAA